MPCIRSQLESKLSSHSLGLQLYVVASLVIMGCCLAVHSEPASSTETYTIRIEIDDKPSSQKAVKSASLTTWSKENNVYKAMEPLNLGTLADVVRQSVSGLKGEALKKVIALNSSFAEDKVDKPSVATEIVQQSAPGIILPIGVKVRKNSSIGQKRLQSQQIVTLSRATDVTPLKMHASEAALINNSVLIPDTDPKNLVPSSTRTVQLELTASELASLNSSGIKSTVVRGKLPVTLETAHKSGPITLDSDLSSELKGFLAGKKHPKIKPLLIILDDGWPTDSDFLATKNFIGRYLPSLWKSSSDFSSLEAAPVLKKETVELGTPGPPLGSDCTSLNDCDFHSKKIHYAIAPMRDLVKNEVGEEPIDVIYIPLNRAQLGAEDILEVLWKNAYSTGRDLAPNSPLFFEKNTFEREKSGFLESLPSKISGSKFDTNWGVISSVIHFANRYALSTGAPVLINTSWTTEDVFGFNPPSASTENILIVAAAGNHCVDNACEQFADTQVPERQFIHRAANSNDIILVVNQDKNSSLTCGSSRVQTNYPVVGFDGAIDGDCGTSFSAPRVALLLALRLAYYPMEKIGSKQPMKRFASWLQSRPGKPRCISDTSFNCLLLTPSQLFSTVVVKRK